MCVIQHATPEDTLHSLFCVSYLLIFISIYSLIRTCIKPIRSTCKQGAQENIWLQGGQSKEDIYVSKLRGLHRLNMTVKDNDGDYRPNMSLGLLTKIQFQCFWTD
jgi:hypothetical protein